MNKEISTAPALIHIGIQKTGSTAIQDSLHGSAEALATLGIFVPPPSTMRRTPRHIGTAKQGQVPKGQVREDDMRILLEGAATCGHFVLSSELLFRTPPEQVLEFIRTYVTQGQVTVVLYLRDPVPRYISGLQQRSKSGFPFRPPSKDAKSLSYAAMWASAEGMDVKAFAYGRDKDRSWDITTHFAQILSEWTGQDITLEAASSNVSMSAEQVACLDALKQAGMDRSGQIGVSEGFMKFNKLSLTGTRLKLSDAAIAALTTYAIEERNEWVKLFPDISVESLTADSAETAPSAQMAGKLSLSETLQPYDQKLVEKMTKRIQASANEDPTARSLKKAAFRVSKSLAS
jgi:hypothetical protein